MREDIEGGGDGVEGEEGLDGGWKGRGEEGDAKVWMALFPNTQGGLCHQMETR